VSNHSCQRRWQAEALEDGRLDATHRASFERHLASCLDCSEELAELRQLKSVVAQAPVMTQSELEWRRSRTSLLGEANRLLFERRPLARRMRSFWPVAVPLALALAVVIGFWHHSHSPSPSFEVVNIAHAQWTLTREGAISRVKLGDGTASFHVEHVASGARFLVALPDGEIEVRGTRFVVAVSGARTRSVAVSEGVVALQLGAEKRLLASGEHWQRDEVPTSDASARVPTPLVPAPVVAAAEPERTKPANAATAEAPELVRALGAATVAGSMARPGEPKPAAVVTRSVSSSTSTEAAAGGRPSTETAQVGAGSAGARFAEAVAAFHAGDYGRADALMSAFMREFPRDARAEDAAFLRADARARRGDWTGAAAAAREYLARYPSGLRRPEAERLTAQAP
jgi:TolA-binding protein